MERTTSIKDTAEIGQLLIVGIGTERCGDDAAGLAVARSLHSIELPGFVKIAEFSGDGASLINVWEDAATVILIDCVSAQTLPGTIVAIDLLHGSLPPHWQPSTHNFGLVEAIEFGRVMGRLPASLMLYGIQGKSYEHGRGLSPEVRVGVEKVAAMIELELLAALDRS